MSTTDTRAAFEALLEEYKTVLNSAYCQCDYNEELVAKSEAAIASLAATEAAKATGTAGEQTKQSFENIEELPLPPYVKYALHCLAGEEAKAEAERQMREYGQQCAKTAMAKVYAIAVEEKAKMDAEAARQPAPVVAVKTWESRLAGNPDRIFSEVVRRAMEAEISDLRVAVAASQQSKNLMAICEALRPFAEAYKPEHHTQTDDPKFQEFLDRNQITPNVTMGDFRRAHEAYHAATNRSQPGPETIPPAVGVSRDAESPSLTGVLVTFARPLSDGQLRELHEYLNRSQP